MAGLLDSERKAKLMQHGLPLSYILIEYVSCSKYY